MTKNKVNSYGPNKIELNMLGRKIKSTKFRRIFFF